MSALGQSRRDSIKFFMSALTPKADIPRGVQHVRFVPKRTFACEAVMATGLKQRDLTHVNALS